MAGEKNKATGNGAILVVGGGIAGITATLEAAEVGADVILVEKNPYLGGRVARMNRYFPKLCPPTCGLEINFKRMRNNSRIRVVTLAEVESVSGQPGSYEVTIRQNPRYVNENCTSCGACAEACSLMVPNEFDLDMSQRKAAYLPFEMAYPNQYVLDPQIIGTDDANRCLQACKYNAIDLTMQPRVLTEKVASIIVATGWRPYDAKKMDKLGFGRIPNVITNVMMERLASTNGPTQGKLLRPSDKKPVRSVIFAQCAGSRDENHLAYCSGVCCLASMKQATYVREQDPEAQVRIFYIDVRAMGKFEDFYAASQKDGKLQFVKGKVAKIEEDPATQDVIVEVEDTMSGEKIRAQADMVVLATGMVPNTAGERLPMDVAYDEFGFVVSDGSQKGIYAAGCAKRPVDVASALQDATGSALKAIQCLRR
ncbi:MAG: CoB--CoM heterodisulfide reductase iron-sulfur subunit A family protein [bacterium]